ncbi:MAG: hypothetical protein IGS38_16150 [Synechococcales cyanobacterium M58_A2018_015]|nr:hypothetical protein [Synechococcales cyanobacterium M58_A2018_015]
MTHDPTRPSISPFQAQAELELLQLMLQEDAVAYPWNPVGNPVETEAYFAALEQEVMTAGWTAEELAEQGRRLANQLDQVWASVQPAVPSAETVVSAACTTLLQQFAAQVPQSLLESIVQRAQAAMMSRASLAEQMVQCVRDCLPTWSEADLLVLARPFAYAMRGSETETLEAALRSMRCAAWTELSGVEQARLSLAIARYAIAQMPAPDHHH